METINLTIEESQHMLSDRVFDDFKERISKGATLEWFMHSDDKTPIKVIRTVEELNLLRKG